jgi:hypothetical protein
MSHKVELDYKTYDTILQRADLRKASTPEMTRRDALIALGQEHPDEPAYYEAYRRYQVGGDGLRDYDEACIAKLKLRVGK